MSEKTKHPPIARFKTAPEFAEHFARLSAELGEPLACDSEILRAPESPLARPIEIAGRRVGNRFCIHPMEGWDGHRDGTPSEWTLRRWRNFGLSGAKLIWGGEAVAVLPEGRANPNQLFHRPENEKGLVELLAATRAAHLERYETADDLLIGLQLTHSGRYCRPNEHDRPEPRTAQRHPILDARQGLDPARAMLTDAELEGIGEAFIRAAATAARIGFDFVDLKHCHAYLFHELLGAKTRPGPYGGDFAGRTRLLRRIVEGIRREAPALMLGVRLSAYDIPPAAPGADGPAPEMADHHFGVDAADPARWDLSEPIAFLKLCAELGVAMVNVTAGSPYYCAHIQRPAAFPPIDSAESRQDPLLGVIRQIQCVRELKRAVPSMPLVGTAYSYLQEYLPHVAQAQVREGGPEFVGLGRVVLSYPTLPDDALARGKLTRNQICRTFSDCTNGPRMGLISGCYPLDPAYKALPEWERIRARKKALGM